MSAVYGQIRHGTPSAYGYRGCRCDICREAHRERCARVTAAMRERGRADPSRIPHGTKGGYAHWGCRCAECTDANTRICRQYQQEGHSCEQWVLAVGNPAPS